MTKYKISRKQWVKDFMKWLDFDDLNFKKENDDERKWLKDLLATTTKSSKEKECEHQFLSKKDHSYCICCGKTTPSTNIKEIEFKRKEFVYLIGTKYEKSALVLLINKIDEIINSLNTIIKK
jgi:hypothetical protein